MAAAEQKQPAVLLPAVVASPSVGSLVVAVVAPVSELLVEVGFVVVQFAEAPANAVPESAVPLFVSDDELQPANTASIATIIIANTANDIFFIIFPPIDQSLSITILL